jgi:hypothetical protein
LVVWLKRRPVTLAKTTDVPSKGKVKPSLTASSPPDPVEGDFEAITMGSTPEKHPTALDYTTAADPPGRVRRAASSARRILLALSAGIVLVIVLPIAALCLRETGEYRKRFTQESALLRAVLDADPAR